MPTFPRSRSHAPRSKCSRQARGSSHRSQTSRSSRITAEMSSSDRCDGMGGSWAAPPRLYRAPRAAPVPLFSGGCPGPGAVYLTGGCAGSNRSVGVTDLFSDGVRRNPYPAYEQVRVACPVFREPRSGLWMVFDYDGVSRVLTDHATFSSARGPDWIVFTDPPRHTKLRALISRAFT